MRNGHEFQEIGHCGGTITFHIQTHEGRRQYSTKVENRSPVPAAWFGLYALPQGIPVLGFDVGGIGAPFDPPRPTEDSIAVWIASDREGMFGRQCRGCGGYWRSRSAAPMWPTVCPYCGKKGGMHLFTTPAQLRYVEHYTKTLVQAIWGDENEIEVVIDMDRYADRANSEVERPAFYYTEERQQSRWRCSRCGNEQDILAHYGYCSSCGYRNNAELLRRELEGIRLRCETDAGHEHLKDIVSHFEGFGRDLVERLAEQVPMTSARRKMVLDLRFHNIRHAREALQDVFGIEIFRRISDERQAFAHVKFLRRHVYEHRAGVADQEYLDASGDTVRLGQRLSEEVGDIRRLVDVVEGMAKNLDNGFHEILQPREAERRM